MKILIVSDTHRKDGNLKQVIARTGHLDMLIHLGDAEGSEHMIASWVNEDCDLQMIPVSYTHLDVYKRQEVSGPAAKGELGDRDEESVPRYTARFIHQRGI